ncbi:uncharacterized protein LOC144910470 isoform X1 [Branchiostoma floridae x Branchiostoma belcheri]
MSSIISRLISVELVHKPLNTPRLTRAPIPPCFSSTVPVAASSVFRPKSLQHGVDAMELRLFVTAFLLVLVAFHVCAEDEKKEVEREVEKRMDAGWMGKRFDASAFGKRLLDRGGKRQGDLAWLGKRFDASAFGKRQDKRQDEFAWLGKRMSDPSAFGKRLLDRGGKRMDAGWMGKRDDNRRGEEEELQKEMDAFFRRFGGRDR